MGVRADILKYRKQLITKAKKRGIYENFGQKEVLHLRDKHDYYSLCYGTEQERNLAQHIDDFDHWAATYIGLN